MIVYRVAFLWVLVSVTKAIENPTHCMRKCNGEEVDYPFGFNPACEFPLNCTYDGKLEFKGFQIISITRESILLNISADCSRPITDIQLLFGRNYAVSSQNSLLLHNCTKPLNGCTITPSLVEGGGFSKCEGSRKSMSCFSTDNSNGGGDLLRYEDVSGTGCELLYSSIYNESSSDWLGFQAVEVAWWLVGKCRCHKNAFCDAVGASGFRCICKSGFVGDGFVNGMGCVPVEKSVTCERTCNGTTLSYPFGFDPSCEFQLNCSYDGRMEFRGFQIRNISWNSLSLYLPADCGRPISQIQQLFGGNYALTSKNGLLLQNCSTPLNRCVIPGLVESNFSRCEGRRENMSCFATDSPNDGDGFLRYEDVNGTGCKSFFSSIVVDDIRSDEGFHGWLEVVQLGWWLNSTCGCDQNAVCDTVGSSGYRCRCNPGFSGDGFISGTGCHNASVADTNQSDNNGGIKFPVLIGGIVAGATFMAILAFICYLYRRRSTYLNNWMNTRRPLSEVGGSFPVPLYPYKDIERATNGFSEKQRLGTSAYGLVYAGRLHSDEYVAIKKIRHRDADGIEHVMNEIKLLSSVSHPNLVRLLGYCIKNREQILVYEYMVNGTLSQHLQNERERALPWTIRLNIASETAQAISFLHSAMNPPIFHRDVKSSNILLDDDYKSKVADFGLSMLEMEELSHISITPHGTPGYVDPQYQQNFHLSDRSDVYSFGVVLVEIITAMKVVDFNRPESEINLAALAIDRIGKGRIDEIIDPFIELQRDAWTLASIHKVAKLAFRCLAYHRDMRPSMMEVAYELEEIRQSWWASVDENALIGSSVPSSCCSTFNENERSLGGLSMKKSVGRQKPIDPLPLLEEDKDSSSGSVQNPWFSYSLVCAPDATLAD